MDTARIIACNIQSLLETEKISIQELASYLGVTRQTLANYIKGNTVVDSVKLVEIAKYFGVSIDALTSTPDVSNRPAILFRTALNYHDATDEFSDRIAEYVYRYNLLAKLTGKNVNFLPEQYNLVLHSDNRSDLNINFDCTDYTDSKYKIDPALEAEIESIANEQRHLLGFEDQGAMFLIVALQQRGINIVFFDFQSNDVSGLSLCDDIQGCFVFVNMQNNMPIERQIFTIAHEYAHLILHRPLYKKRLKQYMGTTKKKNLLDAMADCFAGYLLCPRNKLLRYDSILRNFTSISELVPIKLDLQISLSSLMMALKRYGYINSNVLSSYFAFIKKNKIDKAEPHPLSGEATVASQFDILKTAEIKRMLRRAAQLDQLNVDDIRFFLNLSPESSSILFNEWCNGKMTESYDEFVIR